MNGSYPVIQFTENARFIYNERSRSSGWRRAKASAPAAAARDNAGAPDINLHVKGLRVSRLTPEAIRLRKRERERCLFSRSSFPSRIRRGRCRCGRTSIAMALSCNVSNHVVRDESRIVIFTAAEYILWTCVCVCLLLLCLMQ